MLTEYKNEYLTDFSAEENKAAIIAALRYVDSRKGMEYPLIIGGQKVYTENKIVSINPSDPEEAVGVVSNSEIEHAEEAIQAAVKAFDTWRRVSAAERANYLFKAAAVIRRRKHEFSSWLIEEAGKTWAEADADTAEAIDFLEYYGRQIIRLSSGVDVFPMEGEDNECNYIPLGVGLIISPWNFPLAILVGMTAAAIAAGNTVIMKPASSTPVIAAKFMEVLEEISLPSGVVNYLPGSGGVIGDYLVSHPMVRFINFTGSKDVGLRINRLAAEFAPGQKWIKRDVSELGGKDAIIVDNEADLEEAANGIVESAFGFQGQKCSACSRAIIVEDVYDKVMGLIAAKTKALTIGSPRNYGTDIGPVIDRKAYTKVLEYIEIGRKEGVIVSGGRAVDSKGFFIEPTIIGDISAKARIAQEEIFGPVLAVIKAKDYNDALRIANDTVYGLTGGVYSNNRENLERAKKEFHAGNLYLNRKCTGALVGVNPFGGFNLSGTDSKAGGPDYLTLFMQLKSITERY